MDGTAWGDLQTGACCDYENTPANSTTYGKLYNYYTVKDNRKIAPAGWHIPTEDEWTILIDYLEGLLK
ncbi:MAG: FISUMP domain-containing protein [Bacteroidota bacterium]|nr:FISUMP domain-containing protein [Bacteroidota bacterium]